MLVVENNKWAYSTPTTMQTANPRFVDRARAYGCHGAEVDGNDVLAVYEVTRQAVARARAGEGPTLIEADTMRMRGHAEHDDMKYVPPEMLETWAKRDPIARYEAHLTGRGLATATELEAVVAEIEGALAARPGLRRSEPLPRSRLRALRRLRRPQPVASPYASPRASNGRRREKR